MTAAGDADAPEWWRRTATLRRVPIVAVIIVVVIIVKAGAGTAPPALHKSCTTPAFALSSYSAGEHRPVRWAMTGRPGTVYQLTLGIDHFTVDAAGKTHPVPSVGHSTAETQPASPQVRLDHDCTAHGTFGTLVPAGSYTLKMFALSGQRSAPVETEVASHPFRVVLH